MATFDDGNGQSLFVGGFFNSITPVVGGSVTANQIARFDGAQWHDLGTTSSLIGVLALKPHADGAGLSLFAGNGLFPPYNPVGSVTRQTCPGSHLPYLASSQPNLPSDPSVFLQHGNLVVGHEYHSVFSLDVCPLGAGTGIYFGLCLDTLPNMQFVLDQLLVPVSSPQNPLHFMAASSLMSWGPLALPPATVDGICFDFTGGALGPISAVTRITIQ
jgi:hypothetical protein